MINVILVLSTTIFIVGLCHFLPFWSVLMQSTQIKEEEMEKIKRSRIQGVNFITTHYLILFGVYFISLFWQKEFLFDWSFCRTGSIMVFFALESLSGQIIFLSIMLIIFLIGLVIFLLQGGKVTQIRISKIGFFFFLCPYVVISVIVWFLPGWSASTPDILCAVVNFILPFLEIVAGIFTSVLLLLLFLKSN